MASGKKIEVDENRHGLDAVRRQRIFEAGIHKEQSIARSQSQFQINPMVKDRKGNSKNLSAPLAEKPNRREYGENYLGNPQPLVCDLPEESRTYEQQQVERLRMLPMDATELPATTAQDVGWLLGVAMRLKEGRRPKSAPSTRQAEGGSSTTRSAFSTSASLTGSRRDPDTTPLPPWSRPGTARSSAYSATAPESSVGGGAGAAGSTASSRRSSKVPYDFSRPNVSGGFDRYWRPKSRSDVVTFADIYSEKTGSHLYLRPRVPEKWDSRN